MPISAQSIGLLASLAIGCLAPFAGVSLGPFAGVSLAPLAGVPFAPRAVVPFAALAGVSLAPRAGISCAPHAAGPARVLGGRGELVSTDLADARIELPPGPAARALAELPRDVEPAPLDPEVAAVLARAEPWSAPETWAQWAEWVAAGTPEAAAGLCELALAQGRHADAWAHFAAACAEPARAARLVPRLLPGAPASAPVAAGGASGPLPDGVLLAPTLPPVDAELGARGPVAWSAAVRGLEVGAAVVDLTIVVDESGVQVDLAHVRGGAARVRLVLPEPAGFEIRIEYVDWFRQETLREPLEIELAPGGEPRVLFGRVLPREERWPSAFAPGATEDPPAGVRRGGLRLVVPADDPDVELLAAVAGAIERAAGVPTTLVAVERVDATPPVDDGSFGATDVRLPAGPERARKLAWLASAVERLRLGR